MSAYVCIKDGRCVAVTQFTGETIASGADAAEVIQKVIDVTGAGEVLLETGDYALDRPIRLSSGLLLRGRGRGTRGFA